MDQNKINHNTNKAKLTKLLNKKYITKQKLEHTVNVEESKKIITNCIYCFHDNTIANKAKLN